MAEWTFRVLKCAIGTPQAKFPAPAVKPSVNPSVLRGWCVVCSVSVCQGRVGW